jgi:non-heme chloroperoxidase
VRLVWRIAAGLLISIVCFFLVVMYLVKTPANKITATTDVFGFGTNLPRTVPELPVLNRYTARDGEQLAYRFYDSTAETILIFIHGSSYHGAAYHRLALSLSEAGTAKVYLPNLRGHYMSGKRRGDISYVGQLEDDIADIISMARVQQQDGDIYIGGHSSGGGLAIRFAGGAYSQVASGYILLSPILPLSPAIRGGDAGGWASVNQARMNGLLALNAAGISGFNGMATIEFNKPERYWDGTETLSYSYRLNTSLHPRYNYQADIKALNGNVLVLVGEDDEANDSKELKTLFTDILPQSRVVILPNVNHFGVFSDPTSLSIISGFIRK